MGKVNSKQKEKQEQRSRSIKIYIKVNDEIQLSGAKQECGKVIRGDKPGDKGWGWSQALEFRLYPVSS